MNFINKSFFFFFWRVNIKKILRNKVVSTKEKVVKRIRITLKEAKLNLPVALQPTEFQIFAKGVVLNIDSAISILVIINRLC